MVSGRCTGNNTSLQGVPCLTFFYLKLNAILCVDMLLHTINMKTPCSMLVTEELPAFFLSNICHMLAASQDEPVLMPWNGQCSCQET